MPHTPTNSKNSKCHVDAPATSQKIHPVIGETTIPSTDLTDLEAEGDVVAAEIGGAQARPPKRGFCGVAVCRRLGRKEREKKKIADKEELRDLMEELRAEREEARAERRSRRRRRREAWKEEYDVWKETEEDWRADLKNEPESSSEPPLRQRSSKCKMSATKSEDSEEDSIEIDPDVLHVKEEAAEFSESAEIHEDEGSFCSAEEMEAEEMEEEANVGLDDLRILQLMKECEAHATSIESEPEEETPQKYRSNHVVPTSQFDKSTEKLYRQDNVAPTSQFDKETKNSYAKTKKPAPKKVLNDPDQKLVNRAAKLGINVQWRR